MTSNCVIFVMSFVALGSASTRPVIGHVMVDRRPKCLTRLVCVALPLLF